MTEEPKEQNEKKIEAPQNSEAVATIPPHDKPGPKEKYTEEFVKNELNQILKEIIENKDIVYIGEVFETKEYPRQNYSEWAEKFKNCQEISDTIKKIDKILETSVNVGGLKNKLNPALVIFNLKNNYNWKEKSEVEHSGRVDGLTSEQQEKWDKLLANKEKNDNGNTKQGDSPTVAKDNEAGEGLRVQ